MKRRRRVLPGLGETPDPNHPPEFLPALLSRQARPATAIQLLLNKRACHATPSPRASLLGQLFELLYPTAICGENCDLLGKTRAANAIFISCRHRHRSHGKSSSFCVFRSSFLVLRPSSFGSFAFCSDTYHTVLAKCCTKFCLIAWKFLMKCLCHSHRDPFPFPLPFPVGFGSWFSLFSISISAFFYFLCTQL